jgi:hypothetical protein
MDRTNKIICEILDAGYELHITPWMSSDFTVSIYNNKTKKGSHWHTLDFLSEPFNEQLNNCLIAALTYVNENE